MRTNSESEFSYKAFHLLANFSTMPLRGLSGSDSSGVKTLTVQDSPLVLSGLARGDWAGLLCHDMGEDTADGLGEGGQEGRGVSGDSLSASSSASLRGKMR